MYKDNQKQYKQKQDNQKQYNQKQDNQKQYNQSQIIIKIKSPNEEKKLKK
jgi:hypothetical protein